SDHFSDIVFPYNVERHSRLLRNGRSRPANVYAGIHYTIPRGVGCPLYTGCHVYEACQYPDLCHLCVGDKDPDFSKEIITCRAGVRISFTCNPENIKSNLKSSMKKIVFLLMLSSPLLGQNVDYNKIILPESSQTSEFEEKLVQLAWKNHPDNEALLREVSI